MNMGCTFPLASTAVTEAIGADVKPLTDTLEIIHASGRPLNIIGTAECSLTTESWGAGSW